MSSWQMVLLVEERGRRNNNALETPLAPPPCCAIVDAATAASNTNPAAGQLLSRLLSLPSWKCVSLHTAELLSRQMSLLTLWDLPCRFYTERERERESLRAYAQARVCSARQSTLTGQRQS